MATASQTQSLDAGPTGSGANGGQSSWAAKLRGPGFYRAGWMMVLGVAFALFLTWVIRASTGHATFRHYISGEAILTVSLLAVPLLFLVGIGGFDYWFHWAIGQPTRPEDHSGHGAHNWKDYFRINTDHKVIGIQYTVTSFFFLLVGGLIAMLMRAELAQPGAQFVDANTFNGLFSVHASLLIFLFVIPVFAGLADFVLPLMIGAPDMAFPRLNALSYWLLPVAGFMMLGSFFAPGGAFADGWTGYAPLSDNAPIGQTFFSVGVQFAGASSVMTALNFLVTIITMRAPGMSFFRMPLLVWANFATSLLVVIATPFIAASQFFVLLDRALQFNFFNAAAGGDVLMYQHVFWFYSHPAVYIMMLPGFGIISEIIAVKSRKPIFGYRMMAFSLMTIFAGVYYWFPKMTGRMYDERLGKWHFWSTFVLFNLTFGPMHILGMQGMPRRVASYAAKFADMNLLISIASFGLGLSTLIFLYNLVTSWRGGPISVGNPWRGMTLEWQVTSPPPIFNFDRVPTVVGGPYEYGVPGAKHGILAPTPATVRAGSRPAGAQRE